MDTKGVYFWHRLARFHSVTGTPRWKVRVSYRCHPGRNWAGLDEEGNTRLDEDLRKIAGDISRKQMTGSKHVHDKDINEDEEAEDSDGSMFEDLDEPLPAAMKRFDKAKSPAKSGPVN